MSDAWLRLLLILIAATTVVSGAAQLFAPDFVLSFIAKEKSPLTLQFFATVGMFMLITGAMFLQGLLKRSSETAIPLWIGVQKAAAAGASPTRPARSKRCTIRACGSPSPMAPRAAP